MTDVRDAIIAVLVDHAELLALVKNANGTARIYPIVLPDAPTYPAIVVTKVSGVGDYDLQGDTGVEDARVQVDLFTDAGEAALMALRAIVRRRLSGFSGPVPGESGSGGGTCAIQSCACINDFDLHDTATERAGPRLRRRVLEFSVWNTEV